MRAALHTCAALPLGCWLRGRLCLRAVPGQARQCSLTQRTLQAGFTTTPPQHHCTASGVCACLHWPRAGTEQVQQAAYHRLQSALQVLQLSWRLVQKLGVDEGLNARG